MPVILAANLDKLQSEGFGMSVGGTHGSESGIGRFVGVCKGIEGILHQLAHRRNIFVARAARLAGYAAIDDIDRFGSDILAKLEELVVTHTVSRTVCPDIPELAAIFHRPDGFVPNRIGSRRITFDKTAAGKADEARMKRGYRLRQIRTDAIRPPLPRINGHQRDGINPAGLRTIGRNRQDGAVGISRCRKRMLELLPLVERRDGKTVAHEMRQGIFQRDVQAAGIRRGTLHIERETVLLPLANGHAPETLGFHAAASPQGISPDGEQERATVPLVDALGSIQGKIGRGR